VRDHAAIGPKHAAIRPIYEAIRRMSLDF